MAAPRKDNVKTKILDTTENLLKGQSIDSISLASIAKEAGISKGTLYYHYKTKEAILLDITDRYLDQQWNDLIEWTEDSRKDTSIHRLIKYILERNLNEIGPRFHLIYNACVGNDAIREQLIERYNKFEKMIAGKIAERVDSVSADYLAWTALLVTDGMIIQSELKNPAFDAETFIKTTEDFVKNLLEN